MRLKFIILCIPYCASVSKIAAKITTKCKIVNHLQNIVLGLQFFTQYSLSSPVPPKKLTRFNF